MNNLHFVLIRKVHKYGIIVRNNPTWGRGGNFEYTLVIGMLMLTITCMKYAMHPLLMVIMKKQRKSLNILHTALHFVRS